MSRVAGIACFTLSTALCSSRQTASSVGSPRQPGHSSCVCLRSAQHVAAGLAGGKRTEAASLTDWTAPPPPAGTAGGTLSVRAGGSPPAGVPLLPLRLTLASGSLAPGPHVGLPLNGLCGSRAAHRWADVSQWDGSHSSRVERQQEAAETPLLAAPDTAPWTEGRASRCSCQQPWGQPHRRAASQGSCPWLRPPCAGCPRPGPPWDQKTSWLAPCELLEEQMRAKRKTELRAPRHFPALSSSTPSCSSHSGLPLALGEVLLSKMAQPAGVYKVEASRSGHAKCQGCKEPIGQAGEPLCTA